MRVPAMRAEEDRLGAGKTMRRGRFWRGVRAACAVILLCGVGCRLWRSAARDGRHFDGDRAYAHAVSQCEIGPRVVGTVGVQKAAAYIEAELKREGWQVERQTFVYRGVAGQNVVARQGTGPIVILGTHYDTRSVADRDPVAPTLPVPGANDGASGVAVLLEMARALDVAYADVEVWLVFFDAEDQGGIDGWPFSVGSAYMAQDLAVQAQAIVVVDMVGDTEQQIFLRQNSDRELAQSIWAVAEGLGYGDRFIPEWRGPITDDHVPFLKQGMPAALVIDFDYEYWHTTADTLDKVSPDSLHAVGHVLETWLEEKRGPWWRTP